MNLSLFNLIKSNDLTFDQLRTDAIEKEIESQYIHLHGKKIEDRLFEMLANLHILNIHPTLYKVMNNIL